MLFKKKLKKILFRIRDLTTTEDLIKRGMVVGKGFIRMGETFIDPSHCWLIHMGDNCRLSPRVTILAHDGCMCPILGYCLIAPVIFGNNVFIGTGALVMPGVTIGDNVIVAAGSVVTKDLPSNCVAVGVPAKPIKDYASFMDKCRKQIADGPRYGVEYTLRSKELNDEKKQQMYEDMLKSKIGWVE